MLAKVNTNDCVWMTSQVNIIYQALNSLFTVYLLNVLVEVVMCESNDPGSLSGRNYYTLYKK